MNKNILAVGITILLISVAAASLTQGIITEESEESFSFKSGIQAVGDVIIVDDEGDGDYTSIKEAVNNASPGDIIEVYSGTYYEHKIEINAENITLKGIPHELGIGNDTGKPFINGGGKDYVLYIGAKNITLYNFRIENKDGSEANGIIALLTGADGCTISNNDIAHSTMSCIWVKSSYNKIINNNISHSNIRNGVVLRDPCSNCFVSGNVISDVETGILCWESNHNTVTGNKISRCSEFGIDIAGSYNTVESNTFENNTFGVHILHSLSLGNRIKNNNFINNHIQAQFVYGIPIFWGLTNRWNGNYWNSSRSLPYPIWGLYLYFFPWVQFDWHPAQEPYDI